MPLRDTEPLRQALASELGLELPLELVALLQRRGLDDPAAIRHWLEPPPPPPPAAHFPQLALAVRRLGKACRRGEAVAICGDYDADGMTSTALLVGVLTRLGAQPQAAIPSRQSEGYGLNAGMVERLAEQGVRLLVTVDNGVAADEALERAVALQVEVILTDHHAIGERQPPCLALLHPSCTPADSPYRGLAGVGLAYLLAAELARAEGRPDALQMAMELCCIGTIADMAPLEGVNRRWLRDGLPHLARSPLPGLRALRQLAGLGEAPIDATAIGFQVAPRINAVGRLGDPALVVELLTTDDGERALELARSCEQLNRQRRELCAAIEAEALALIEADGPQRPPFLLLAQNHWHHGVIGIVASRLVERFGRPVALLAGEGEGRLRASVRAPRGFAVDGALDHCAPLLERYGGHPAAGGFTVRAERLAALHEQLTDLARPWLERSGGALAVEPEVCLELERIDRPFWQALQRLEPFGVANPQPLFWSAGCQVEEQRLLKGGHLQLQLRQGRQQLRAIAWRWAGVTPVPAWVDVAYRLRLDRWQGQERLQLELVALRAAASGDQGAAEVLLRRRDRTYWCRRQGREVVIRNAAGQEIRHLAGSSCNDQHPYLWALLQDAALALGLAA